MQSVYQKISICLNRGRAESLGNDDAKRPYVRNNLGWPKTVVVGLLDLAAKGICFNQSEALPKSW